MKLPLGLSPFDLFVGIAPLALIGAIGWWVYDSGKDAGRAEVQAQWNEYKLARAKFEAELKARNEQLQSLNQAAHLQADEELADANQTYAGSMAALNAGFALRLHNSEDRARKYQHLSQASEAERASLASHAAELDRALEQGRLLVGELRTTLGQREATIKSLATILFSDRKLMGETDGKDAASAQ